MTLYDTRAPRGVRIHRDQPAACAPGMLRDMAVAVVDWGAAGDPVSPDDAPHPIASASLPARGVE